MHSQSALTEHVSLNLAPLILLDPVLFALPPSSVQILNERNEIFTIEDDPYMGLSVLSCVRGEEGENKKAQVLQVKAIFSHQRAI